MDGIEKNKRTPTSIRLDSFHLTDLKFKFNKSKWGNQELTDTKFNIAFQHVSNDASDKYFGILFTIKVLNSNDTDLLSFKYLGNFEVTGDTVTEEKLAENPFFRINAPAIFYPYVRAFVSSFTLNAGFKPIILPTINFTNPDLLIKSKK